MSTENSLGNSNMSINDGSRRRNQNQTVALCYCGVRGKLQTSWTNANPGRRFVGCAYYKRGLSGCGFFHLYDSEFTDHEMMVINRLKDDVKKLKKKNRKLLKWKRADYLSMVVVIGLIMYMYLGSCK